MTLHRAICVHVSRMSGLRPNTPDLLCLDLQATLEILEAQVVQLQPAVDLPPHSPPENGAQGGGLAVDRTIETVEQPCVALRWACLVREGPHGVTGLRAVKMSGLETCERPIDDTPTSGFETDWKTPLKTWSVIPKGALTRHESTKFTQKVDHSRATRST